MVLHRRLNYGFNGYEVPPIPRAARSIRKRSFHRKKVADVQMCAFDLLATVAGELLLEGQGSATASSDELLSAPHVHQGSPEIGPLVDEHESQLQNQTDKELINPFGGSSLGTSAIAASGLTGKTDVNGDKVLDDKSRESAGPLRTLDGWCPSSDINSCASKQEGQVMDHIESQLITSVKGVGGGLRHCSSEDPKLINQEPAATVNSDSSIKLYLHKDHYSCSSPFLCRDNVKVVSRDDDEKYCQCTQRSALMKTSRSRALTRHQRIRKLLASRYWRRPTKVKVQELSDSAGELHSFNQYRRRGFKRQGSQRIYPLKRKKHFYSSPSTSDGATGYESMYMCSEKGTGTSTSAFGALGHGATSRLVAGQNKSFQSRESHVKVRIKSFRVPELFIELPETATVGSLKRTVMEAITTLLGGELHVGVALKGRKIRDDSKTLVQTGISHDNKVDGLGFTLEPNSSQVYSSMGSEEMPCIEKPQPVSRPAPASADNSTIDLADFKKSDRDSELVPAEISMDNRIIDPKALITVPEGNVEPLAMVPPMKKSKRYEMAQRRIRRPFSVAEVEALVAAVEKLGTGRWRDVKLLAFDDAEHRTYVDLKDKWKTLVHTAGIAPQQRRGEPVPQDLLDRVLAAHARWSQPQAKQQLKLQPEAHLLLGE